MVSKKTQFFSVSVFAMRSAIIPYGSIVFVQNSTSKPLANTTSSTSANATGATTNITSLLRPGSTAANMALDAKMLQLEASNKPQDIATLAYIWGYPLVTVAGSYAHDEFM